MGVREGISKGKGKGRVTEKCTAKGKNGPMNGPEIVLDQGCAWGRVGSKSKGTTKGAEEGGPPENQV